MFSDTFIFSSDFNRAIFSSLVISSSLYLDGVIIIFSTALGRLLIYVNVFSLSSFILFKVLLKASLSSFDIFDVFTFTTVSLSRFIFSIGPTSFMFFVNSSSRFFILSVFIVIPFVIS